MLNVKGVNHEKCNYRFRTDNRFVSCVSTYFFGICGICRRLSDRTGKAIKGQCFAFGGPITNHKVLVLSIASYIALW